MEHNLSRPAAPAVSGIYRKSAKRGEALPRIVLFFDSALAGGPEAGVGKAGNRPAPTNRRNTNVGRVCHVHFLVRRQKSGVDLQSTSATRQKSRQDSRAHDRRSRMGFRPCRRRSPSAVTNTLAFMLAKDEGKFFKMKSDEVDKLHESLYF